jgi:hypothetical protein
MNVDFKRVEEEVMSETTWFYTWWDLRSKIANFHLNAVIYK